MFSGSSDSSEATADPDGIEAENPPENPDVGAVPPGYDWPTHGGYLGCLISLMASCLIGGFLGTTVFAALSYWRAVPTLVTVLLTISVYLAVTIGLGRLGWILGRRFYREYPQNPYRISGQSGNEPGQAKSLTVSGETATADSTEADIPVDTL